MLCETIFVPLVDALLEQVQTLSTWWNVEDHEEDQRERDRNGDRNTDLVKELEVLIDSFFASVNIQSSKASSYVFHI